MEPGKLGVWSPTDTMTAAQMAELAERVEALGYGALWYPESHGHESFSVAGFFLSRTQRLTVATGIANIYARDPITTRQGQHTLNKLYGGRFLLGLGVSHASMVEGVRGHAYGKPVATMRAYLDGMERAHSAVPALPEPPPTVLAALGPNMIQLAAQRTQGLHTYNVTPEHTAQARELAGPAAWICVEQMVLRTQDAARAHAVAREALAKYLSMPNYRNNWLRLGFTEEDLHGHGSERFLDAMVAWGDDAAIRRRIEAHLAAGATHVCIQPLHPGGGRLPDYAVLEALAP